ncbi:MAG TPA: tetratricopeptide repeat protein, partial [Candidatus Binatia bacterium]|nr:tetratricopeptide repeat protein [Candidatus Binatia bacterium]
MLSGGYRNWIALTLACQFFSILAGSSGIVLPILLILLDLYPLDRFGLRRGASLGTVLIRTLGEKIPFFVLGAASILAMRGLSFETAATASDIPQTEWMAQQMSRPIFYLWKTIAPFSLAPVYDQSHPSYSSSLALTVGGLIAISVGAAALSFWTASAAALVLWLGYLTLVLAPIVEYGFERSQEFGDRCIYLPAVVLSALAAAALNRALHSKAQKRAAIIFPATVGSILIVLTALTILSRQQTRAWRNSEELWRHAVSVDPDSRAAREKLAEFLTSQNRESEALAIYQDAVQANAASAPAHADLARALALRGRLDEAQAAYRRALELDADLREARLGMGNILVASGDYAGAIEQYRAALARGATAGAHVNLGFALAKQGKLDEAVRHYQAALELAPGNVNAHLHRGNALVAQGRPQQAVENFRTVLRLRPSHSRAHFALAGVLAQSGNMRAAMDHYQEAINYDPEFADAYLRVGIMLADQGRWDTAADYYRHALAVKPNLADARVGLARALAAQGRKEEALREYEEARRLLQTGSHAQR